MLTSFADDEALFDAFVAGAAGYVLKQITGTDLVPRSAPCRRSVLARPGDRAGDRPVARPHRAGRVLVRLTAAGAGILELIGEGLTNRQIAERMFLAEKTVKNRISVILSKLGVGRRIQAAVIAERIRERETGQ